MSGSTGEPSSRMTLGDVELAYERRGAGPLVVLVHGLAQDHSIWSNIVAELPNSTTLTYDIRGHGESSLGNADGTLTQLADDLIALLEQVGPAICVGFSLGGTIVLHAAASRPDLVTAVVAVATSSIVGRAAEAGLLERIDTVASGNQDKIRELILQDSRGQLANPDVDLDALVERRMLAIADPAGYLNGARAVVSMRVDSLQDRLASISCPVLIVNGEHDLWCPRRAAEIMMEQLPAAKFVELEGVGHLITDDNPQALLSVIRPWIEKVG
ncbi:MAG: alpha/beta hydrolase [Actinomycetes bacterium]